MTAIRDLLGWLVERAEARPADRDSARELLDQAHPGDGSGGQGDGSEPETGASSPVPLRVPPVTPEGGSQP